MEESGKHLGAEVPLDCSVLHPSQQNGRGINSMLSGQENTPDESHNASEIDRRIDKHFLARHEHNMFAQFAWASTRELDLVLAGGYSYMWYFRYQLATFVLYLSYLPFTTTVLIRQASFSGFRWGMLMWPRYLTTASIAYLKGCIVCLYVVTIAFSIGLHWYTLAQRRMLHNCTKGTIEDPIAGQYDSEGAVNMLRDRPLSVKEKIFRRTLSVAFFIALLVGYVGIQYAVIRISTKIAHWPLQVAVGSVLVVVRLLWRKICHLCTYLEGHLYETDYRKWYLVKLYVFNILAYASINVISRIQDSAIQEQCALQTTAESLLVFTCLDFFVIGVVKLTYPLICKTILKPISETGRQPNNFYRVKFDLAEEYVEILYRQLLIMKGSHIVPIFPLIGLTMTMLEFWLDRYKLFRLVRNPIKSQSSYSEVRSVLMVANVFVSIVDFPTGIVWIAQGFQYLSECALFH